MSKRALVGVTVTGLLLCGVLALGATLRVPQDYATIQAAVNVAKSGDVILVAPGTYDGFGIIEKTGITIRGDVKLTLPDRLNGCPVLDAVDAVVVRGWVRIVSSSQIVLETLAVMGGGVVVTGSAAVPSTDITLRYCRISFGPETGVVFGGYYARVTIVGCDVSFNGQDGIHVWGKGSDILIEDSCINNNGRLFATGVGIRVGVEIKGLVIRRNRIVGNAFAGIHPD